MLMRNLDSKYTGRGCHDWGTMIFRCKVCGELVAEYDCDEDGVPTDVIFDNIDEHGCDEE